jgi:transposase
MAIADAGSLPLALSTFCASPHEVTLVETTLEERFTEGFPQKLIGDRAYDSDKLDASLASCGVEMISPHRKNRKRPATQDGRKLRRYRRRWRVERLFAWLQNFRRVRIRDEFYPENYEGFVQLAGAIILLRRF